MITFVIVALAICIPASLSLHHYGVDFLGVHFLVWLAAGFVASWAEANA